MASLTCRTNIIRIFQLNLLNRTPNLVCTRSFKRWKRPYLQELYKRRNEVGPEKPRHRSAFYNWNYDSELYAFTKRLNEDVSLDSLKKAFTHSCYIEAEKRKRESLEMDTDDIDDTHNEEYCKKGLSFLEECTKKKLSEFLPQVPNYGINSISSNLCSIETVSRVAKNLGFRDLQLCEEETDEILHDSFVAFLGLLLTEGSQQRCEKFITDFILSLLISDDVLQMLEIRNPHEILSKNFQGEITTRILFENGRNTVESAFLIGVYADRKLIGYSGGETEQIAEEMAMKDAVYRQIGLKSNQFNINTLLKSSA
ncbi:unnamed protein product [Dimorphilus gyrociliatus]|uniref:Large ribosomal subunit protein mL44 n=1 Tax=Dimorphilus gyrociliatus TaxID=2664684 RepID=A0A7I8VW08_9ANNE|nr:unnamed protein product [Dimorphilus gyrociliatus]